MSRLWLSIILKLLFLTTFTSQSDFGQRLRLVSSSLTAASVPTVDTQLNRVTTSIENESNSELNSKQRFQSKVESSLNTQNSCPPGRIFEPCECNEVSPLANLLNIENI